MDTKRERTRSDGKPENPIKKSPSFSDLKENHDHHEGLDVEGLLRQLIEAIPKLLDEHPDAENADILASVAGAYALKLMLKSNWSDEQRLEPTLSWLDSYSRYAYSDKARLALQPIALGVTMVTAASAKVRSFKIPASRLKESILRFGFGSIEQKSCERLVKDAFENELFSRVDESIRLLAVQLCSEILSAETVNDRLLNLVLASRTSNFEVNPDDEALFPGVLATLRGMRPGSGKLVINKVLTGTNRLKDGCGCPHCHQRFDKQIPKVLRTRHATVCNRTNCRKVIFYLEDPAIAERVKEILSNV